MINNGCNSERDLPNALVSVVSWVLLLIVVIMEALR